MNTLNKVHLENRASLEAQISRLCLDWASRPDVLEALFGPRRTPREKVNRARDFCGLPPLRRKDVPDKEVWAFWNTPFFKPELEIAFKKLALRKPENRSLKENASYLGVDDRRN